MTPKLLKYIEKFFPAALEMLEKNSASGIASRFFDDRKRREYQCPDPKEIISDEIKTHLQRFPQIFIDTYGVPKDFDHLQQILSKFAQQDIKNKRNYNSVDFWAQEFLHLVYGQLFTKDFEFKSEFVKAAGEKNINNFVRLLKDKDPLGKFKGDIFTALLGFLVFEAGKEFNKRNDLTSEQKDLVTKLSGALWSRSQQPAEEYYKYYRNIKTIKIEGDYILNFYQQLANKQDTKQEISLAKDALDETFQTLFNPLVNSKVKLEFSPIMLGKVKKSHYNISGVIYSVKQPIQKLGKFRTTLHVDVNNQVSFDNSQLKIMPSVDMKTGENLDAIKVLRRSDVDTKIFNFVQIENMQLIDKLLKTVNQNSKFFAGLSRTDSLINEYKEILINIRRAGLDSKATRDVFKKLKLTINDIKSVDQELREFYSALDDMTNFVGDEKLLKNEKQSHSAIKKALNNLVRKAMALKHSQGFAELNPQQEKYVLQLIDDIYKLGQKFINNENKKSLVTIDFSSKSLANMAGYLNFPDDLVEKFKSLRKLELEKLVGKGNEKKLLLDWKRMRPTVKFFTKNGTLQNIVQTQINSTWFDKHVIGSLQDRLDKNSNIIKGLYHLLSQELVDSGAVFLKKLAFDKGHTVLTRDLENQLLIYPNKIEFIRCVAVTKIVNTDDPEQEIASSTVDEPLGVIETVTTVSFDKGNKPKITMNHQFRAFDKSFNTLYVEELKNSKTYADSKFSSAYGVFGGGYKYITSFWHTNTDNKTLKKTIEQPKSKDIELEEKGKELQDSQDESLEKLGKFNL